MNVILTEGQLNQIIEEEFVNKNELNKSVKSAISDTMKKDKEFEKRVKEIASEVVKNLFRILWQRNVFYDEIKR